MPKFFGKVGYGESVEKPEGSGIWVDDIREISYYGDVVRDTRNISPSESVNDDLTVGNSISIVADAFAFEHFFKMKYVEWSGVLWKVSEVEVQRPRLILRLGGVYNGPTADSPETSG